MALAAVVGAASYAASASLPRQADERHHHRQILRFCSGDWTVEPRLTTFPGYHALAAAAARPLGRCDDLPFLRLVNVAWGVLGSVIFHLARRAREPGDDAGALLRTAQFALLPVLAPHHPQVYTDSLATTLVLAGLLLAARGATPAGSAVLGASLLVRQTNAAWLGLLLLDELVRRGAPGAGWTSRLRAWLRATWPGLLCAALFAAFVVIHGGLVLKERKAHPIALHSGNGWLFLGLVGFLLLPHAIAAAARVPRAVWVAAAGLGVLFLATFSVAHPWNRFEGFLRNDLLLRAEASLAWRAALGVPITLGAAALAAWARSSIPLAFWPAAAVTLLVPSLIEHRYAIVPLTLLLLWMPRGPRWLEASAAGWCALLTAWLLAGRAAGAFLV